MATEPMIAALNLRVARRPLTTTLLSDYWALTKPEVNFLIVITTFVGFFLGFAGSWRDFPVLLALHTVLGTLLVAGGTGTLNQYLERDYDAQMRRTSRRPLAAGRLNPSSVLWFGVASSVAGSIYLAVAVNFLTSALALATLLSYLFLYTPLKRKTPLCTLVGAFSGAMPPLIGWAGATGSLNFEVWILYAVLFLWQFPHFMAIAWMYREDYDRAGYQVLPRGSRARISFVGQQTLLPLLTLLAVCLVPTLAGQGSLYYCFGASLLSLGFLYCGAQFVIRRSAATARRLLATSIFYLPLLFLLLVLTRPT